MEYQGNLEHAISSRQAGHTLTRAKLPKAPHKSSAAACQVSSRMNSVQHNKEKATSIVCQHKRLMHAKVVCGQEHVTHTHTSTHTHAHTHTHTHTHTALTLAVTAFFTRMQVAPGTLNFNKNLPTSAAGICSKSSNKKLSDTASTNACSFSAFMALKMSSTLASKSAACHRQQSSEQTA
jgi:hypothetical protein